MGILLQVCSVIWKHLSTLCLIRSNTVIIIIIIIIIIIMPEDEEEENSRLGCIESVREELYNVQLCKRFLATD